MEGEGFEPSEQVTPLDRLAICCLKPLSHPSVILVSYFCVRKLTNPVSAAHPVFASAEPEDNSHLQVWQLLVPQVRLELTRLSARASKTRMATITSPGQNLERVARIELATR